MLEAYLPLEPLGRGATGIVFLAKSLKQQQAQEKQDQKPPLFFAVKASKISQAHDLQRARNEERILGQLSLTPHPFLPRLHSAFDHANFRFLVLDFCSGGNLYSLQHSLPDKRFSSAAIRFYAAEILLALEHLHRLGIVYRDLKPENILLSADGHIMLTDFDLSIMLPPKEMASVLISHGPEEQQDINHEGDDDKLPFTCFGRCASVRGGASALLHTRSRHRVMPTTASGKDARTSSSSSSMMPRLHSFVGTEEYIAPEVIRGTGHDFSVDWWALGVLLFEMAHASTPFSGATSKETFVNVLREEPIFPGLTSESALSDLIRSLLAKDPLRRLGTQGGAAEIKSHPFFSGLFWDALQDVCRPPHIPPCMLAKLESVSEGFDLLSHLEQVECTRIEARAKRKLERKQTADCQ